jgi:hypothetical protein
LGEALEIALTSLSLGVGVVVGTYVARKIPETSKYKKAFVDLVALEASDQVIEHLASALGRVGAVMQGGTVIAQAKISANAQAALSADTNDLVELYARDARRAERHPRRAPRPPRGVPPRADRGADPVHGRRECRRGRAKLRARQRARP